MVRTGLILLLLVGILAIAGTAFGGDEWRSDFDDVCGKTSVAMELSRSELLSLIVMGERVEKMLEAQDETTRKVFLKRIQKCLNLFRYVADTKKTVKSERE
jgi:hypothetical protein